MRVLKLLWKFWCGLWPWCGHSAGIDSHKWESKMEIFARLPGRRD